MASLLPGKIVLPKMIPKGISVGSVITLLVFLGNLVLSALGPPQPPKKTKESEQAGEDDNKNVLKMLSAAEEIDNFLTYQRFGGIFIKGLIATITSAFGAEEEITTAAQVTEIHELEQKLDDEILGPLREELKKNMRMRVLQQQTRRKTVTAKVNQRQGSLHGKVKGTQPPKTQLLA